MFRICIAIVIFVRGGFFLLTPLGVPMEGLAIGGAVALILVRWLKNRKGITDIVKRTPWHIFLFAFGMYVLVYGLHNIGLSHYLTMQLKEYVDGSLLGGTLVIGVLLTALSNLLNNLPAVMIGTLAIVDMGHTFPSVSLLGNCTRKRCRSTADTHRNFGHTYLDVYP
jgi:arsenical pump membrane protein